MEAAGSIDEVLADLRRLDSELAPDDGVRWFNKLYLAVTERVAEFDRSGHQRSPGFLARLDVVFAGRYFDALAAAPASGPLPTDYPFHAWKPLFEARRDLAIAPVQFALAGMNAHINHDLALGVRDVCVERGVEPTGDSAEHSDYDAVNPLIAQVEHEVTRWLMTGLLEELHRAFRPVDDVVAVWSVEHARAAAWTRAEVLWHLRGESWLEDEYAAVNDRAVGLAGRAMLVPVGLAGGAS